MKLLLGAFTDQVSENRYKNQRLFYVNTKAQIHPQNLHGNHICAHWRSSSSAGSFPHQTPALSPLNFRTLREIADVNRLDYIALSVCKMCSCVMKYADSTPYKFKSVMCADSKVTKKSRYNASNSTELSQLMLPPTDPSGYYAKTETKCSFLTASCSLAEITWFRRLILTQKLR